MTLMRLATQWSAIFNGRLNIFTLDKEMPFQIFSNLDNHSNYNNHQLKHHEREQNVPKTTYLIEKLPSAI